MPCACSVATVPNTMASATRLENVIPVGIHPDPLHLIRGIAGMLAQWPRINLVQLVLRLLRRLPEEKVRADRRPEHREYRHVLAHTMAMPTA
jgi:hypothetical protein